MDEKDKKKLTTTTAKGNINKADIHVGNANLLITLVSDKANEEVKIEKRTFEYDEKADNDSIYTVVNKSREVRMRCVVAGDFWYVASVGQFSEKILFSGNNASEELELKKKKKG